MHRGEHRPLMQMCTSNPGGVSVSPMWHAAHTASLELYAAGVVMAEVQKECRTGRLDGGGQSWPAAVNQQITPLRTSELGLYAAAVTA